MQDTERSQDDPEREDDARKHERETPSSATTSPYRRARSRSSSTA
jgi:hypothetical protein